MGLDSVELVMEIEDEFELSIPNAVAAELTTPGEVSDYVVSCLKERSLATSWCRTARAFHQLRRELMNRFATPRDAIRPAAAVSTLIPPSGRREWSDIADKVGLRREPRVLFRPNSPPRGRSVADVIRTRCKNAWYRPDGSVDARLVFQRVRFIVAEQVGLPLEKVNRDSHFIRDLGMD